MAKRNVDNLRGYAIVGAEQRLLQIAAEAAEIFRVFPELRERGRGFSAVAGGESERSAGRPAGKPRRRRRRMSADARKRISDAQKARWARQKGQASAQGSTKQSAKKR